ncbi:MAG: histidine--tRNA ligase [Caulobacteraceae bacterium]|nr:MAG: histidine--tRNA ligase [Caulobacteraceae bacterium]
MTEETFRPEARAPRGFADKRASQLRAERRIVEQVSAVYERWGFEPLDTGAFEYADALGKFLPDSDRPNEGVFALQDDDEQWMALRYDLTAPLARFAAQNWETLPKPYRRYAFGPVWRNEKPGPGRFREFIQCDADTVGSDRPEADAEILAMAAQGFKKAGLLTSDFQIKLSSRKLLDSLLDGLKIVNSRQRLAVLRAIDKLDRLGIANVECLLGDGRLDESGAYTKGARLPASKIEKISEFLCVQSKTPLQTLDAIANIRVNSYSMIESLRDVERIYMSSRAMGVSASNLIIDTSVVRGLEYYTGAVFEAELRKTVVDERGQRISFGSIGGGGRYDDLVSRFTGKPTPATGFSFGVSRMASALQAAGKLSGKSADAPVVIAVLDEGLMAKYLQIAAELRSAKIPCEIYLGRSGMRPQMKYADRRQSPAVILLGSDEHDRGEVTVKDLVLGSMLSADVASNEQWRQERPGQFTVPRSEIVPLIQIIRRRSK